MLKSFTERKVIMSSHFGFGKKKKTERLFAFWRVFLVFDKDVFAV